MISCLVESFQGVWVFSSSETAQWSNFAAPWSLMQFHSRHHAWFLSPNLFTSWWGLPVSSLQCNKVFTCFHRVFTGGWGGFSMQNHDNDRRFSLDQAAGSHPIQVNPPNLWHSLENISATGCCKYPAVARKSPKSCGSLVSAVFFCEIPYFIWSFEHGTFTLAIEIQFPHIRKVSSWHARVQMKSIPSAFPNLLQPDTGKPHRPTERQINDINILPPQQQSLGGYSIHTKGVDLSIARSVFAVT